MCVRVVNECERKTRTGKSQSTCVFCMLDAFTYMCIVLSMLYVYIRIVLEEEAEKRNFFPFSFHH